MRRCDRRSASTIGAVATRVRRLISIEDDPHSYEKIARRLDEKGLTPKVSYYHFPVEDLADRDHPYVCAIRNSPTARCISA